MARTIDIKDALRDRYCSPEWATFFEVANGTGGHLEFKNGKLRQVTAAPKLAPVAIDRSFMAALMRRSGQVGDEELRAIIEKETAGIREREKNRVDREIERRTERAARLAKRADEIKELTGIDLESWVPAEDVAQAMRFAMTGGLCSKYGKFRSVMQDVDKLSGSMREAFATLLNLETVSE